MSTTAFLFLLVWFAGVLLAFVRHPIYGMYAYMLVFYMSPGESWWSTDVPQLPWALVTAAVTVAAAILRPALPSRPAWYQTSPARWLILFALWLWVQTPWALSTEDHLFLAKLFTKYVFLYAVLYSCLTDWHRVREFFLAHILGCLLWGYMAYQNPNAGHGRLEDLGFGDVAGSAFASMHLGTGLAFAGFVFLGAAGLQRWLAFGSIPFILNAIILMATRGAFVGLIGGGLAALFLSPRSQRRMVALSLGLGAILLSMLAHDFFWERMATITPPGKGQQMEESAASRIEIAKANLRMFVDHPMGVGHRGNDLLSPEYMPPQLLTPKEGKMIRSAHNTFMAILVDHSLIGLLLIVGFHFSTMRALLDIRSRASPDNAGKELIAYTAALLTALVIYWGNAQFANVTKAEVFIWMAALAAALHWMAFPSAQPEKSMLPRRFATAAENGNFRNPSAQ